MYVKINIWVKYTDKTFFGKIKLMFGMYTRKHEQNKLDDNKLQIYSDKGISKIQAHLFWSCPWSDIIHKVFASFAYVFPNLNYAVSF